MGATVGSETAPELGFFVAPESPLPDIDVVLHDLAVKQQGLSAYIDSRGADMPIRELVSLLRLHGQNASRLGGLLRAKRALSGDAADGISGAIAQALDELSTELGVDL